MGKVASLSGQDSLICIKCIQYNIQILFRPRPIRLYVRCVFQTAPRNRTHFHRLLKSLNCLPILGSGAVCSANKSSGSICLPSRGSGLFDRIPIRGNGAALSYCLNSSPSRGRGGAIPELDASSSSSIRQGSLVLMYRPSRGKGTDRSSISMADRLKPSLDSGAALVALFSTIW